MTAELVKDEYTLPGSSNAGAQISTELVWDVDKNRCRCCVEKEENARVKDVRFQLLEYTQSVERLLGVKLPNSSTESTATDNDNYNATRAAGAKLSQLIEQLVQFNKERSVHRLSAAHQRQERSELQLQVERTRSQLTRQPSLSQTSSTEYSFLHETEYRITAMESKSVQCLIQDETALQMKCLALEREIEKMNVHLTVVESKFEKRYCQNDQLELRMTRSEPDSVTDETALMPEHLRRFKEISAKLQTRINSSAAEEIAGILYKSKVLTLEEHESVIKCKDTSANASQALIEILLQKPTPEEYYCFLFALRQKNLSDAYILLTLPESNVNEEHVETIRRHYLDLLDNLDASVRLLASLYASGVLTERENEDLRNVKGSIRRAEQLLLILSHKSRKDYDLFLGALNKTGQRAVGDLLCDGRSASVTGDCPPISSGVAIGRQPLDLDLDANNKRLFATEEALALSCERIEDLKKLEDLPRVKYTCCRVKDEENYSGAENILQSNTQETSFTVQIRIETHDRNATEEFENKNTDLKSGWRQDRRLRAKVEIIRPDFSVSEVIPPRKGRCGDVCGVTILGKKLYLVRSEPPGNRIEVYRAKDFEFQQHIDINDLRGQTSGLTSCPIYNCLYVGSSYNSRPSGRGCAEGFIHKVDLADNNKVVKWNRNGEIRGLSVNSQHNLLVTCRHPSKLIEYAPCGEIVHEISFQFGGLQHAIQIDNDRFLVSHYSRNSLHQVCVVDAAGKELLSYGDESGSATGRLKEPKHLAVDKNGFIYVADARNKRIVVLDRTLKWLRDLNLGIGVPSSLCVDERHNRLVFAGLNKSDSCVFEVALKFRLLFG